MKSLLLYVGIVVVILGLAIWWQVYKYNDCKKVGHATFYCVMHVGS